MSTESVQTSGCTQSEFCDADALIPPLGMFDVDSEVNFVREIQNYSVEQLVGMAQVQMIESEMEKKHQRELLYHVIRQKLEMHQLKRQLGVSPDIKGTSPDSLGLTNQSPNLLPTRARRRTPANKRLRSLRTEHTFDSISDGGDNNEDWEALRIMAKISGAPELGHSSVVWSDSSEKMSSPASYMNEEFLMELRNLHMGEDQVAALPRSNLRQCGYSFNAPPGACPEENTNQQQNFTVELFKTEICRSWAEFGFCPYGQSCRFAHGRDELLARPKPHWKYKTKMCKKFLAGYCPYGSRCCFVHHPDEQHQVIPKSTQAVRLGLNHILRRTDPYNGPHCVQL